MDVIELLNRSATALRALPDEDVTPELLALLKQVLIPAATEVSKKRSANERHDILEIPEDKNAHLKQLPTTVAVGAPLCAPSLHFTATLIGTENFKLDKLVVGLQVKEQGVWKCVERKEGILVSSPDRGNSILEEDLTTTAESVFSLPAFRLPAGGVGATYRLCLVALAKRVMSNVDVDVLSLADIILFLKDDHIPDDNDESDAKAVPFYTSEFECVPPASFVLPEGSEALFDVKSQVYCYGIVPGQVRNAADPWGGKKYPVDFQVKLQPGVGTDQLHPYAYVSDARHTDTPLSEPVEASCVGFETATNIATFRLAGSNNKSALILPAPGKGSTHVYHDRTFCATVKLAYDDRAPANQTGWQTWDTAHSNLFIATTPQTADKKALQAKKRALVELAKRQRDFNNRQLTAIVAYAPSDDDEPPAKSQAVEGPSGAPVANLDRHFVPASSVAPQAVTYRSLSAPAPEPAPTFRGLSAPPLEPAPGFRSLGAPTAASPAFRSLAAPAPSAAPPSARAVPTLDELATERAELAAEWAAIGEDIPEELSEMWARLQVVVQDCVAGPVALELEVEG